MSVEQNNKIKWYGVVIGLVTAFLQHGFYLLGHGLSQWIHIIGPYCPKIAAIDDLIPIVPIFIIPYIWSYAYWAMAPMAVSKCETKHYKNYLAAYLFSCIVGMLMLALAPTYMDRTAEGLYDTAAHSGIFADMMRFWYTLDGTKIAYNLLPSFHCLNSTVSLIGVWGRKEIPLFYRIYSLVLTITIYAATCFVKQHYFMDVIAGALVAIIVSVICFRTDAGRIFDGPIEFFKKLFSKKKA